MSFADETIFVAGHRGLAGSAICRRLASAGAGRIVTRTRQELDLCDQQAVARFFAEQHVDRVVLAAARVGGIHANNNFPAEFIYQNLMIQCNVIHQAFAAGIRKLLFLGSSCIYPKFSPQPMQETHLLTGSLEPTNAPYAVAKIAGIQMCEAYNRQYGTRYRAAMPTNLYGPNDYFDLQNAHVLPAMIRKFHLAKMAASGDLDAIAADVRRFGPLPDSVSASLGLGSRERLQGSPVVPLWGTGEARREFLFVEDMADACQFLMDLDNIGFDRLTAGAGFPFVNVGCGTDLTIRELALQIAAVVGYDGRIAWDTSRPDGTPRKLLDVSRLNDAGWTAPTRLEAGLKRTYAWYLSEISHRSEGSAA